jgi:Flp pilus assembly protein TadD
LALNPSHAQAHHWYALLLAQHRRFDDALGHMRSARAADPYSPALGLATAYILLTARRFDDARREYDDIVKVDPANFQGHVGIVETHLARGALADARQSLDDAYRLTGRASDLRVLAAYMYALAGDERESRRLIAELTSDPERAPARPAEIAGVLGVLGDTTEAFSWFERAVNSGDTTVGYVAIDPRYDALRADPRFERLLARLGLPSKERSP